MRHKRETACSCNYACNKKLLFLANLLKNLNCYAIIYMFEWTTTRHDFSDQPLFVRSEHRFFVAIITVAVATEWQQKIG